MSLQPKVVHPHFVMGPPQFMVLRIVQLIFSVIVLGLSAYAVYYFNIFGGVGPELSIFTAIASIISLIYIFIATYGAPSLYNYWAILSLDIFLLVFWLISFAITAAWAGANASLRDGSDYCDGYFCYDTPSYAPGINAVAATAGVGGLMFVLFIVSTAIMGVFIQRHKQAGGHCTPLRVGGGVAPTAYEQNSRPEAKFEMQNQPGVAPYPAQNNSQNINSNTAYQGPQAPAQYSPQPSYQQPQAQYQQAQHTGEGYHQQPVSAQSPTPVSAYEPANPAQGQHNDSIPQLSAQNYEA